MSTRTSRSRRSQYAVPDSPSIITENEDPNDTPVSKKRASKRRSSVAMPNRKPKKVSPSSPESSSSSSSETNSGKRKLSSSTSSADNESPIKRSKKEKSKEVISPVEEEKDVDMDHTSDEDPKDEDDVSDSSKSIAAMEKRLRAAEKKYAGLAERYEGLKNLRETEAEKLHKSILQKFNKFEVSAEKMILALREENKSLRDQLSEANSAPANAVDVKDTTSSITEACAKTDPEKNENQVLESNSESSVKLLKFLQSLCGIEVEYCEDFKQQAKKKVLL